MAKDVDLSSSEWIDLVFEGKNKDFGAYTLRKASAKRHNKAMLVIVIILIAVGLLGLLANTVLQEAEARPEDQIEQALIDYSQDEEKDEPEDEPEQERYEEQQPEALKEEILNTVKSAELVIVRDEEVQEDIKSQDELKDTETAIGNTNFDQGTDDLNVVREHKNEVIVEEKHEPVEDNRVFDVVEQQPQFPGGQAALMKYLSDNIRYPAIAQENNIQGRVVVQFVVTKTGKIGEVKVIRGKDPDLDKEAVRVVKTLPDFIPGKMNGHAVNVWFTLPVNFKLQGI